MKKRAFALVETLITVGIIGIIAILTIPTLIHEYYKHWALSQLTQTYSILSTAFNSAIEENGSVDSWCNESELATLECSYKAYEYIKPYLKGNVEMKCKDYACFPNIKRRDGVKQSMYAVGNPKDGSYFRAHPFVFLTGARMTVHVNSNKCYSKTHIVKYNSWCGEIGVDLNGYSGPNVDGIDYFGFLIYTDGILPAGDQYLSSYLLYDFVRNCDNYVSTSSSGRLGMCSSWLLTNKNMDYLRCNNLSWTGKRSCKE